MDRQLLEIKRPDGQRSFIAAIAFMLGLHLVEPGPQLWTAPWTWLGGLPALAGLGLNIWAAQCFVRRGVSSGIAPNNWAAAIFKHLRPAKAEEGRQILITDGPFAFSRHPMYLGMILAVGGLAVLLGTATPLLVFFLFAAIMDRRHARPEEAALGEEFAEEYRAYAGRVRRWF